MERRVAETVPPGRCSVAFDYAATPRGCWSEALDAVTALGAGFLRVQVPWSRHEVTPGIFEWGERIPELGLDALLRLAHRCALRVWVHPGPWLAGQLPDIPAHVLRLSSVHASRTLGREREPSILSARLIHDVELWHREVARVVMPHLEPDGPVCGFSAGTPPGELAVGGLLDKGDESIRFERRFLALKYPGRQPLADSTAGDAQEATADPLAAQESLDRVEAGEAAARSWVPRTLESVRGETGRADLFVTAAVHDSPLAPGADVCSIVGDSAAVERVFPVGLEADFDALRLFGLRAADCDGAVAVPVASDPLASPRTLSAATRIGVLAMSGVRALDLAGTPEGSSAGEIARWLRLFGAIEHAELRRHHELCVVVNRETARLAESRSLGGGMPADLAPVHVLEALRVASPETTARDCDELDAAPLLRALTAGLRRAAVPFSVCESTAPQKRLERERALLVVGFERLGRPLLARLFEWAEAGGTLILGPRLPERDWDLAPLALGPTLRVKDRVDRAWFAGLELSDVDLLEGGEPVLECDHGVLAARVPLRRGALVHFGFRLPFDAHERAPEATAAIARALAGAAGAGASYVASDPEVETELFSGSVRRFLFLANPTFRHRAVTVEMQVGEALREVRGSGVHVRVGEPLGVPARSVLLRELVQL